MREIEILNRKEGDEGLSSDDITKRESIKMDVANEMHIEEIPWRQKIREKWLKDQYEVLPLFG